MSARKSAGLLAALVLAIAGSAQAQTNTIISTGPFGVPSNGQSMVPQMTSDGRYVVYLSQASNIVPFDSNGFTDVFVYDRVAGRNELVSLGVSGAPANYGGGFAAISDDGRCVAFQSEATNLVSGGATGGVLAGMTDVFVRDREHSTTELVSVGLNGAPANNGSVEPAISADGRFVAFASWASNLVAGDTNGTLDVFVRDRVNRTTELVSLSTSGVQANDECGAPAISPDGRYVAFCTRGSNLVANDTNANYDIFVHDRLIGTTQMVSVDPTGAPGNATSNTHRSTFSADDRYFAFQSWASNLVAGDTNNYCDVFVRDLVNGTTEMVSVGTQGQQGNGHSQGSFISADGRYVAFSSESTVFSYLDASSIGDIYVRDRQLSTTVLATTTFNGAPTDGPSAQASISADGRWVAFSTAAKNLVAGDTNGFADVVLCDRVGAPVAPFCFGDDSGAPCPCGNSGAHGGGCANSLNPAGAVLTATGQPHTNFDTLVLAASGMPDSTCLYIQGVTRINGGAGTPFGDGLRCVGGGLIRLGLETNVNGMSRHPQSTDPPISVSGIDHPGDVRTYQVWYRNPASFCTSASFNLTNGLELTWVY